MSTGDGDFYESGDLPRNVKIPVERFEIEEDDSISGGGSTGGGGGGGGAIGTILKRSAHPLVALFHIGFKIAAVASYLLLGILLHNFVIQFVVTIILLAVDFWTTKNLSGRLLVGLRWWTDVQEDGSTSWRFECIEDDAVLNGFDSRIFWWTMYLQPLVWTALGLLCIFRFEFKWLLIVGIALTLTMTNLVAYFKCCRQQQEQMRSYITSSIIDQALGYFSGP